MTPHCFSLSVEIREPVLLRSEFQTRVAPRQPWGRSPGLETGWGRSPGLETGAG